MPAWFTAAFAATIGVVVSSVRLKSAATDLPVTSELDVQASDEDQSNRMVDEGCPNF
ncbi:hypothetical protein [Crateriforma conspicua]|uniref:Uncharacterized protein n=1 Tax=Crateriforma conspicua TaxID=2527996 RepID=A0A5C6FCY8_9PLAN|nr:hypothetical protein [Crateriforma conspicua]TWU59588.1 hypothetical protein V7x_54980 [Crateriforma conspicua]